MLRVLRMFAAGAFVVLAAVATMTMARFAIAEEHGDQDPGAVPSAARALHEADRLQHDDGFRAQVESERRALRDGDVARGFAATLPPTASIRRALTGEARDSLRDPSRHWSETNRQPLLVLVSFAMPDQDLRLLAAQAGRVGAVLVLRGLVDGSFPKTQAQLAAFRDIPGASFQVDPTLFRRFGVDSVPTFILPLELLQACMPEGCPVPAHVRIRGEAGVDHVLEQIERHAVDPRARQTAGEMLALLRRSP